MSNPDELLDFDLESILNEFHQDPAEPAEPEAVTEEAAPAAEEPAAEAAEPAGESEEIPVPDAPAPEPVSPEEEPTVRLEKLSDVPVPPQKEAPAPEPENVVIELDPKQRLRELKRKLIAGPEKRYYELSELGLGKLQTSIFLCLIIALGCAAVTTLSAMDMIPQNRLRLVIFSQVLAMLVSALLGCQQMLDGLADLGKARFTVNTMLALTFLSCCVDAVFCLKDLRIPCCGAFSLEMALALLGRYHRRAMEMSQMDTLRKAVRLFGLVRVPEYLDKLPGFLRTTGQLEDFTENYEKASTPEKVQSVYAFVSFLLSIAIAVFAGVRHGASLAVQVLSTSLLVAVPASYFISLTRPAAILERRLHMVGTVLCGWQGVKALRGKAAFPLSDDDLFPAGTAKLNGIKFYGDRTPAQVVRLVASLICAAGGGLSHPFRQLLTSRGGRELPVTNLKTYGNGGVGGEIGGESVLLGSLSFLQDMGVEIPQGNMVNQAVYAAIDGELCAVVAISYAKMRSSSGGLVSLCGSRKLTPVLTGGDFMVTESLISSRFNVNTRRMVFPTQEERAQLSKTRIPAGTHAAALTTRDDLISYAYAASGARALRTSAILGNAIHILGGVLGLLIMAVLAFLGSAELLTPTNVLLYQLVWLLPGVLISEWTRAV